jgi:hypothetical protein
VTLRYVRTIAWTGLAVVSMALVYVFVVGHMATDWPGLIDNPLGLATLIDAYVGFALFSCWIVWRETRLTAGMLWVIFVLIGGNFVSALYVLVALHTSGGEVEAFWLGARYKNAKLGKLA